MEATETQATTIRLPKDLYERLRREAYDRRTSQTAIVTELLDERYRRIDGSETDPDHAPGGNVGYPQNLEIREAPGGGDDA